MIRRDMINASTDEFTGATMDTIVVPDLITTNGKNVKLEGGGSANSAEFEIEIDNDYNLAISFHAENEGDARKAESEWGVFEFSFYDYETDTEHSDIEMSEDTISELESMVNDEMNSEVIDYAYQEYLER